MRRDFRRIGVIFKLQKIEDIIYHCAVQLVKLDAKIYLPFCDFYSIYYCVDLETLAAKCKLRQHSASFWK